MTDKSFGDHTNRNILKNPLLSTAVTGLSLEDLTHNAVLLPVSLSQEVTARPDQQTWTQTRTLGHTDNAVSNYPSGDADCNPVPSHLPPIPSNTPLNLPPNPNQPKLNYDIETPKATLSKTTVKSDDDFDVNEYFARLHGTRYVSAPLNSTLKEDNNANLEETEGNLEEINLNEPEKEQQSITADIAQNFSQLPTVLPQMASAVFSSFSNMLQPRKSREPTPETRTGGYQEVQFERPPDMISEYVAPPKQPPTLPPTAGTGNYRLHTKKKYAQIPGLTTGDNAQIPFQSSQNIPPTSQTVPQYFVPNIDLNANQNISHNVPEVKEQNQSYNLNQKASTAVRFPPKTNDDHGATKFDCQVAPPFITSNEMRQAQPAADDVEKINEDRSSLPNQNTAPFFISRFSDASTVEKSVLGIPAQDSKTVICEDGSKERNVFSAVQNIPVDIKVKEAVNPPVNEGIGAIILQNVQDINQSLPPPPMFSNPSNLPRRDSQSGIGKAVLPPSVARRIGANQPIIKQTHLAAFTDSIFVPAPVAISNENANTQPSQQSATYLASPTASSEPLNQVNVSRIPSEVKPPSVFTPPTSSVPLSTSIFPPTPAEVSAPPISVAPPAMFPPRALPAQQPSIFTPPSLTTSLTEGSDLTPSSVLPSVFPPSIVPAQQHSIVTTPNVPTPVQELQVAPPKSTDVALPRVFQPNVPTSEQPPITFKPQFPSSIGFQDNTPQSIPLMTPPTLSSRVVPPVTMFTSSVEAQASTFNTTSLITQEPLIYSSAVDAVPVKIPEPPKAVGSTSFRMTKKRPQYYAGPIEGIGAISNNVKPVIAPVDTGAFQGALFTPAVDNTPQAAATLQETPFDISHPVPVSENIYEAPFDLSASQPSNPSFEATQYPNYNTTFDMSRQTTDSFSEPKLEQSGFGLLGSLKSKLSSIDINKIQNSVTTFFDPAYNSTKNDAANAQEGVPYGQQHYTSYRQHGATHESNFDIFVPQVEQAAEAYSHKYDYQSPHSNQYNYGQQSHFYQNQEAYNYYQNPGHNVTNYFDASTQSYQTPSNDNIQETRLGNWLVNPAHNLQNNEQIGRYDTQLSSNVKETDKLTQEDIKHVPTYSIPAAIQNVQDIEPQQIQDSQRVLLFEHSNCLTVDTKESFADAQYRKSNVAKLEKEPSSFFNSLELSVAQKEESPSDETNTPNTDTFENITSSVPAVDNTAKKLFESIKATISPIKPSKELLAPIGTKQTSLTGAQAYKTIIDNTVTSIFDHALSLPKPITSNEEKVAEDVSSDIRESSTKIKTISTLDSDATEVSTKEFEDKKRTISSNDVTFGSETNTDSNVQETSQNSSNTLDMLLQSNPADFFGSFSNDSKTQSLFSNFTLSDEQSFEASPKTAVGKDDEYIRNAPQLNMSSAPLFGLSTMLADKTKELSDLQDEMRKMSLEQSSEIDSIFNRGANISFFENLEVTDSGNIAKDEVPDLNICETCREVNKPEDREIEKIDDLTTQLIENITAPIQFFNPVEVPLTERNTPVELRDDFDSNQCAEISHITEETIEAIQVKSATELLDDPIKNVRNYGWSEESYPKSVEDSTYSLPFQPNLEQDYSLNINPNSIGFFGGTSLFENLGTNNDLQKSYFGQDDVPTTLSRKMSIPSAPPAEDDAKSEGIDVHSIEQDAKQDFPIFEEYVIEPENDFRQSTDSINQPESFTSRVDKYKTKEEDKTSPVFDLATSPSSSIHMASYFDTGNYAAETHYRNSLSSPSQMRVPPGFEDDFKKRLIKDDDKNDIPYIPDTSTQTRPIYSPTFSTAHAVNTTCITSSKIGSLSTEMAQGVASPRLPDFDTIIKKDSPFAPSILCAQDTQSTQDVCEDATPNFELLQATPVRQSTQSTSSEKLPDFDSIFGKKKEDNTPGVVIGKTETKLEAQKPLLDPINFFASNVETTESQNADEGGFNRLASYFSSPAKTDHSKSFFELSQSQKHYRQETKITEPQSSSTENIPTNIHNIPQEQYLTNLNLMTELTSYQNTEFKPEKVVRTVNYFTVEYDNENLINELNKGEPDVKKDQANTEIKKPDNPEPETVIIDEKKLKSLIQNCEHCCNFSKGPIIKLYNVNHYSDRLRKCMDDKSDKADSEKGNMEPENLDNINRQSLTVSVNFGDSTLDDTNEGLAMMNENRTSTEYTPVKHHWFYRVDVEGKSTWRGFSTVDSRALEEAFNSPNLNENTLVATDGGRYDVNVKGRLRFPVYWTDKPTNVMRCSWFYKGTTDARYVPYAEAVAEKLEDEYRLGMTTGEWHRRLVLPSNELVVFHGPAVMVHFLQGGASDAFSAPPLFTFGKRVYRNPPKIRVSRDQPIKIDHLVMLVHGAGEYRHQREKTQSTMRPVRRGCDESEIEEVEPSSIDHLLLLCHGVGSACDMRFRAVEEVVDDFRATSLQLIQSHYRNSYENGVVGRVEVLPISWHATLHSGETGVDKRLARVTLDSIPRLRNFTNDTVLDVLFYTSPVFSQTIINTVCAELNRIYKLFCQRNPSFNGGVSLGGHSLGSVILYDLLCHQDKKGSGATCDKVYVSDAASTGTGQPTVKYPQLSFEPVALYALGSPIAIFECIRGVDSLGTNFALPTCKNFFNIFHPYDPIAYRIEPLINPQLQDIKPFLIPHHKGRKRMHLELKDTMARVGADIKQKLVESIRNTWSSMWKTQQPPTDKQLEKVVEEELEKEQLTETNNKEELPKNDETTPDMLGKLNSGRRVDYVLQEAPFEMINEYLFAMSSHVCYWESEDTMLLMLREIYSSLGVSPDSSLPQRNLTVQRTRAQTADETIDIPVNNTDHPSTSRGTT